MMGYASLYPSYGLCLSQCEILRALRPHEAGRLSSFPNSTPFPIAFLSVYWHTKPGADPCKNKAWE